MGFDKPDLGFVVHFQRPGSVVAYYQQVGRAGRAVQDAYGILLQGREDDDIHDYFIHSAFPSAENTKLILSIIEQADTIPLREILSQANLSWGVVERILKLLEIDGAIVRDNRIYYRTTNPWRPNTLKQEQVTMKRMVELQRMRAFMGYDGCLMEYIAHELDDPYAAPCGRCSNCVGDFVTPSVTAQAVQEALAFLKREHQPIAPRKLWTGDVVGFRGMIKYSLRIEEGRALCQYGDPLWGRLVEQGKYTDGQFSEELVDAVARLISESWRPDPMPTWVTSVPSLRRPELVAGFARRLAYRLNLPFYPIIIKNRDTPPQKTMQNSQHQARNALEAFTVQQPVSHGPVLLVDDIVDSRWTLTVCGAKLREAGSGPVFPVALAVASAGGLRD